MVDVMIGGLPAVGAVVLVVAVLVRVFAFPSHWSPAAAVVVGLLVAVLVAPPGSLAAALDVVVDGLVVGVLAVGGHSSVKHLLESLETVDD